MPVKANSANDVLVQVVLLDDEAAQLELTRLNLESADPKIKVAAVLKPSEGLLLLRRQPFDCIVSDYQMPEMNGVQLCSEVRKASKVPFIIYTARGSEEVASAAFLVGVDDYVRKEPTLAHYSVLAKRIRHVVEKRRVEDDLRASNLELAAANENLMRSEKELIAFNEKLVASEEALKILNEELSTSNEELSTTEEELRVANEVTQDHANKLETIVEERTARLFESEQRLRGFMDSTEDGLTMFDSELRLIDVNRVGLEAMLLVSPPGTTRSELLGKRYLDIFPNSENSERYAAVEKVQRTKESVQWEEVAWVDPVIWYSISVFPVGSGVGIISRDISKQMRLRLDNQRSETMSDVERMGATVAHDLRGPLDQIVQSINMIKRDPTLTPRMLGIVEQNAVKSQKMILEWRSSMSKIVPHPVLTDLGVLINSVVVGATIPDDVKIQSYVGDGLESVLIDPDIMRRVLDNIVKNSVDAMPEGGMLLITAKSDGSRLEIRVRDTGVGIPVELRGRIFSLFTTKTSGMGLGLLYCRRAVEAQGGSINFESKVDVGTTFILTFPLQNK